MHFSNPELRCRSWIGFGTVFSHPTAAVGHHVLHRSTTSWAACVLYTVLVRKPDYSCTQVIIEIGLLIFQEKAI
jgi:hypothetical protein